MDWFRALRYCRENFTDIASYSISDSQLQILLPNGDRAWIGVISHPEIRQRDCGNSSFRYWDDSGIIPSIFRSLFGVADLQRSGKWRFIEYFTKIPFVCFDNLPAPGKENVQKKGTYVLSVFYRKFCFSFSDNLVIFCHNLSINIILVV